ncbi:MAG: exodeoxyribonuclease III [Alphaproteobacteria bacterium]|nr:MAG: exodeoxyribonuclease III [Alphaproteobacteria bacterium]
MPVTKLKIATWNINSVRLRINIVEQFLSTHKPDILCLQETKVINDLFPRSAFEEMGYPHLAINGQKGYHGVAIVSRLPFEKSTQREFCEKGDTRHICAHLPGGIELHNYYIPAGGDIPDPLQNEKFQHKLDFLDEMAAWYKARKSKKTNKLILVGDFNIAPLEHDVWDHKKMLKVVSHTPVEVDALAKVQASHDFIDVMRSHVPEDEKLYTWWSYRAKDWDTADRGRRLDHIWASPALADALGPIEVLREARGWTQPSDHVPVMTTFNV